MNPFDELFADVGQKVLAAKEWARPLERHEHRNSIELVASRTIDTAKVWEHSRDSAIVACLEWAEANLSQESYLDLRTAVLSEGRKIFVRNIQ